MVYDDRVKAFCLNRRQKWEVPVWVLFGMLGYSGCGPAHSVPQTGEPLSAIPSNTGLEGVVQPLESVLAQNMNLRLIQKNHDQPRDLPDHKIISQLDIPAWIEKSQIILLGIIRLPVFSLSSPFKGQELYLSWPDQISEWSIIGSHVIHQTLLPDGRKTDAIPKIDAWHNPRNKTWYFSVSQLFEEEVNESNWQILSIELLLNSNQRSTLEIHFRTKR